MLAAQGAELRVSVELDERVDVLALQRLLTQLAVAARRRHQKRLA
jgi:hypothetical protein